ncbi:MAG: acyl-CoA synthetase, partial [Amylibacter sp.]|nr:acyl-CoA synthetase [Amylibacter sp.]
HILSIGAIPLTTVGKIYKPSLRCDAAKTKITDLVQNELGLIDACVDVVAGGSRGMRVTVILPEDNRSSTGEVEDALAAFLFEARVQVGTI